MLWALESWPNLPICLLTHAARGSCFSHRAHVSFSEEATLLSCLWATAHAVPLPKMLVLVVSDETPTTQVNSYGDEI